MFSQVRSLGKEEKPMSEISIINLVGGPLPQVAWMGHLLELLCHCLAAMCGAEKSGPSMNYQVVLWDEYKGPVYKRPSRASCWGSAKHPKKLSQGKATSVVAESADVVEKTPPE